MSFVAGQRIEARCSRCKDTTGHVVIVVMNDVPVKVECAACKSVHKYYAPAGQKKKESASVVSVRSNQERGKVVEEVGKKNAYTNSPSPSSSSNSFLSSQSKAKTKVKKNLDAFELESLWKKKLMKTYAEPKKYRMDAEVSLGDSVDHSVFGVGIVEEIVADDKANFLFKEGYKMLKCVTK